MTMAACIITAMIFLGISLVNSKYTPDWNSLDKRPLPHWYDEAKLGIFIHWGVFSVPSFDSEWFWYSWKGGNSSTDVNFMKENYRPDFTYADFASQFTAEFYDPDDWADIFNSSGARYIVYVSKHHEGFTNWPSKYAFNWNSMDVGPKRDIVGELAKSIRTRTPNIRFGLYHSLFEWFNPLFLYDQANKFTTQEFVNDKTMPELYEIVNAYKPEVIFSDGQWPANDTYWKSKEFLAWLYNESPVKDTVVVNDRWGKNTNCKHGDYWTCGDRFHPGKLFKHKWENAMTIEKQSWGYRRNAALSDYFTIEELLANFITTVSCGGNFLMNVGPRHDGIIDTIYQERLKQVGDWLKVNGEAIYSSKPWSSQNDTFNPDVWYTMKKWKTSTVVYAITLKWPKGDTFTLRDPKTTTATIVTLLGRSNEVSWKKAAPSGMEIDTPVINPNEMPCQWAWVFKLENLANP